MPVKRQRQAPNPNIPTISFPPPTAASPPPPKAPAPSNSANNPPPMQNTQVQNEVNRIHNNDNSESVVKPVQSFNDPSLVYMRRPTSAPRAQDVQMKKQFEALKTKKTENNNCSNYIPEIDILSQINEDGTFQPREQNQAKDISLGPKIGYTAQDYDEKQTILSPDYDLSNFTGELDSAQKEEISHYFYQKMEKREHEFSMGYKSSSLNEVSNLSDSYYREQELKNELAKINNSIRKRNVQFSLDKFDFKQIEEDKIHFLPEKSELNSIYFLSEDSANEIISGNAKNDEISLEQMKNDLEFDYDLSNINLECDDDDNTKYFENLYNTSSEKIENDNYIIDLSSSESSKMINRIIQCFADGISVSFNVFINDLIQNLTTDSKSTPEFSFLLSQIMKSKNATEKYDFICLGKLILNLIFNAQCSSLFRYLNESLDFKKNHYFQDSPMMDYKQCDVLANIIENIECAHFENSFIYENLPKNINPISSKRMVKRIKYTIEILFNEIRNSLLQNDSEEQPKTIKTIIDIFKSILLLNKNGKVAPEETIWAIFEEITKTPIKHPKYKDFCKIIESFKTQSISLKEKATRVITKSLESKILPYIILFSLNIQLPIEIKAPAYIKDTVSVLRIAHAFLKLITIDIKYDPAKISTNFKLFIRKVKDD